MIIKFDMDAEEAEKAEIFADANLISFFKDSEGKYYSSDKMIELMKYNEIKLNILEEIPSEKVKLFHNLLPREYADCMRFGDDVLRAFGYINGFDVLIYIDERAIKEYAHELQELGPRFFNYGPRLAYMWCGFNSKRDDPLVIHSLLIKLYPKEGEQMFKSISTP
jgi:hypothetical protein